MRALSARERRLIAVGLLVLALALAWLLIVQPLVIGFIDRAAQRRDLRAAHARNERILAALPALRSQAEAQARTAPRFMVIAANAASAAEALKARVRRTADDEGVQIKALDDLSADAPLGSVEIRVDTTLSLKQLSEMLRRLQSEEYYVVVEYFAVAADKSFASGRAEPIDVRLDLSAAWRPPRGPA